MKKRPTVLPAVMIAGILWSPGGASAQPGSLPAACCVIVDVDANTGIASARVTANGNTFHFKPNSAAMSPSQLSAGHPIYVNFRNGQVSTDGRRVCCQVVPEGPTGSPEASSSMPITTAPAEILPPGPIRDDNPACCVITAMDLVSGVVSGRDPKTGYTFKFTVIRGMFSSSDSSRVVRNLTIGDKVWADLRGKGVKVDASKLCCGIIEESDH